MPVLADWPLPPAMRRRHSVVWFGDPRQHQQVARESHKTCPGQRVGLRGDLRSRNLCADVTRTRPRERASPMAFTWPSDPPRKDKVTLSFVRVIGRAKKPPCLADAPAQSVCKALKYRLLRLAVGVWSGVRSGQGSSGLNQNTPVFQYTNQIQYTNPYNK